MYSTINESLTYIMGLLESTVSAEQTNRLVQVYQYVPIVYLRRFREDIPRSL